MDIDISKKKLDLDDIDKMFYHKILNYFLLNKLSYQDAEDLTHDVIIKVISKQHLLKDQHFISTWIYSITKNVCYDYYRSKTSLDKRVQAYNYFKRQTDNETNISFFELTNLDINIKKIMEDIPLQYREVLYLKYFQNMEIKSIAISLSISISVVKMRLYRGRKYLRKILNTPELYS